jgi:hypothetical protein
MSKLHFAATVSALIAINCGDDSHLRVVADAGTGGSTSAPATGGVGGALPLGTGGSPSSGGTGGATQSTGMGGSSMTGGTGGASTAIGSGGNMPGSGGGAGSGSFGGAAGSRVDAFTSPDSSRDASNSDTADGNRSDGPDGAELPVRDAAVSDNPAKTDGEGSETTPGGICSEAPCLAALFIPCQPSGQCRISGSPSETTSLTAAYCYSNGVTQRQELDSTSHPTHLFFAEALDGALCFTIEATLSYTTSDVPARADYVFRDGDGNQVATAILFTDDGVLWVTCNGGAPAQLSKACANIATPLSGCETGPCEY